MITAIFKKQDDLIVSFKIEGHANYAPIGQDIVCAAVSALVTATSNTLIEFCECSIYQDDGFTEVIITEPNETTEIFLQPLLIGINGISEQYPNNMKVVVVDGQEENT